MKIKNLAALMRRIQTLALKENPTFEETQELDFYKEIYKILGNTFKSKVVETFFDFNLKELSLEKANTFADPLGLHVTSGGSNTVYLSCAQSLEDED